MLKYIISKMQIPDEFIEGYFLSFSYLNAEQWLQSDQI